MDCSCGPRHCPRVSLTLPAPSQTPLSSQTPALAQKVSPKLAFLQQKISIIFRTMFGEKQPLLHMLQKPSRWPHLPCGAAVVWLSGTQLPFTAWHPSHTQILFQPEMAPLWSKVGGSGFLLIISSSILATGLDGGFLRLQGQGFKEGPDCPVSTGLAS